MSADSGTPVSDADAPEPGDVVASDCEPSAESEPPVIGSVTCWRCGKSIPESTHCRACGARLPSRDLLDRVVVQRQEVAFAQLAMKRMLILCVMLLGTSLIVGLASALGQGELSGEANVGTMAAVELLDTIIVLFGLFWVPRLPGWDADWSRRSLLAWACCWPALIGMLGINFVYHAVLNDFIQSPLEADAYPDLERLFPWYVGLVVIQPAIIEELFFRQVALGTLRSVLREHSSVWIGAIMFGLAHLGQPLSIPYLVLIGALLGYARLTSGGLWLPMMLHGVHNGAVLWLATLE